MTQGKFLQVVGLLMQVEELKEQAMKIMSTMSDAKRRKVYRYLAEHPMQNVNLLVPYTKKPNESKHGVKFADLEAIINKHIETRRSQQQLVHTIKMQNEWERTHEAPGGIKN